MTASPIRSAARRAFLQRSGALGMAGAASGWALNLAAIGEAAAFDASDYKALVCVFLTGGNDHNNTIVPYDPSSWSAYWAIRGGSAGVALPRDPTWAKAGLHATALAPATPLAGGRQYALAPSMAPLLPLFNAGSMAVVLNVGPLVQPVTRAQYLARSVPLPPKLFSHNDQQSVWQASQPEGATAGWGGRMGDLALASNGGSSLFTCVTPAGNAVMLSGTRAVPYLIGTSGAVRLRAATSAVGGSTAVRDALAAMVQRSSSHLLEDDYAAVVRRSIAAERQVGGALAAWPESAMPRFEPASNATLAAQLAGNPLAAQLRVVARMIAARGTLGVKRQVFLVSMAGFDHHDGLVDGHPLLLGRVAAAMRAFHDTMQDLGVADRVVQFTASDFGRTLSYNGDGSDHGWGGHHWVIGGGVKGRAFYGTPPAIEVDGNGDVGAGRLIPTTSVDQYGGTLARWFGVSSGELATVLPNVGNFGAGPAFL